MPYLARGQSAGVIGASPAPPLTPPDEIAGLQLWLSYDSNFYQDDERTTPADGAAEPIGAWDDISGEDSHWLQSSDAARTEYAANAINGKPGVYFDGTDNSLVSAVDYGQAVTWFFVIKPTIEENGGVRSLFDSAPYSGNTLRCHPNAIGTFCVDWHNQDPQISCYISDDWHVVCVTAERNPTNRIVKLRLDGVEMASSTGGTGALAYSNMALGTVNGGSGYKGYVSTVLNYGLVLGDDDLEAVEAYLINEFAHTYPFSDIPTRRLYGRWEADSGVLDAGSAAASDGENVATWQDMTGKGRHLTQGTEANQPNLDLDGLNGHPCLVFSGSETIGRGVMAGGSIFTWYFVIQPTAATVNGLFESVPFHGQSFRNYGSNSNCLAVTLIADPIVQVGMDTDPHLLTIIYDRASNNRIRCRLDGADVGNDTSGENTSVNWGGFNIGSINGTPSLQCKVAAVVMYDDVQTEVEIDATEAALAAKYGIVLE